MEKPIIEKAMEEGIFQNFKSIRDNMYKPETPIKLKYGGVGIDIFSNKYKNLRYVEHTDGWTEVANKKLELLGVIYYWKKWKKYVWEQCPEVIMSDDCLVKVFDIIQILKKKRGKKYIKEAKDKMKAKDERYEFSFTEQIFGLRLWRNKMKNYFDIITQKLTDMNKSFTLDCDIDLFNEIVNIHVLGYEKHLSFIEGQNVGLKQAMATPRDAYFINHIESHSVVKNAPFHRGKAICKICSKTVDEIYAEAQTTSSKKDD